MWLLLWRASRLPLNSETVCNTQKALQSNDMPPSPPPNPTLLQLVCVCVFFTSLYPSVYSGPNPPSPISISTIQALQLTNLLFIVAQRLLCSSLCRACCPLSRSCSGSLHSSPAPTFSPCPFSTPPDCNNVSKCGSACC